MRVLGSKILSRDGSIQCVVGMDGKAFPDPVNPFCKLLNMSTPHNSPDPVGLAIAREIQERLRPAEVILFGSRADGSHSPGHRGPHRHSPGRGCRRTDEGDSPGNPRRTARYAGVERHNDDPG